jgi:Predicted signal-transduction protein containing cAMP-binding and CBS domains
MTRSIQLKDYIIENPVKVLESADLFDAVALIVEHRISGLCVVNDNGDLVGVLSELDCLEAILSATYDDRTNVGKVADYMTREVVTSGPTEDIVDVASAMLKSRHRRRPVIKDGKLIGQISCRQLLQAFQDFTRKD